MTTEEIKQIEEYFRQYSDSDLYDVLGNQIKARWFSHKEEDYFQIVIFEDNEVYQAGTEANTIGIELKTIQDLQVRFKSFTGAELDYIPNESWKSTLTKCLKKIMHTGYVKNTPNGILMKEGFLSPERMYTILSKDSLSKFWTLSTLKLK